MKYLLTLLFTVNLLNASFMHSYKNRCIEDYYTMHGTFYYQQSSDMTWYATSSINQIQYVLPSYSYDSVTKKCTPDIVYYMGMEETQFNFILGLIGVIFGAVFMFFTTQIFTTVGGRR